MPGALKCPIWNTPAHETRDSDGDKIYVFSHRAGGAYTITGSAAAVLQNSTTDQKKLLTTWLCRQRQAGIPDPIISTDTLMSLQAARPLPVSQRVDAALLFFDRMRLNDEVTISNDFNDQAKILSALTESDDLEDLRALFQLVEQVGWLSVTRATLSHRSYRPSITGWNRIEQLTSRRSGAHQAFVAMWFDPSMDDAYTNGIAPAISDCGWKPLRIDNKEHVNKIDDEIIAEIRRSHFVVADFTCDETGVRGGVYYEAGFARGLNIPVIWTCRSDAMKRVHFDTRQYSHIVWETPADLREKLRARIGAVIGDGPQKKD